MRLPHESLGGSLMAAITLTAVLFIIVRFLVSGSIV